MYVIGGLRHSLFQLFPKVTVFVQSCLLGCTAV